MKFIPILLVSLVLTGCAVTHRAAERGAELSDEMLSTAEFTLCRGITVGAWVRRYGNDRALANAWRTLCSEPVTQVPAQ